MTLDEARRLLAVTPASDAEEIREAFRRRAREVHPDRHPDAGAAVRKALEAEFDRVREARDILLTYTLDPLRKPAPEPDERPRPETRRAQRESTATTPPSSTSSRPPRVTMRYQEFVVWTDAAGFGAGQRTRFPIDWARIGAWSTVSALALVIATMGLWVPMTL